jgi:DHA2 family multidrug resistance protein
MAEHLTTSNPAVVALTQRVAALQTAGGGGDAVHGQSAALQMLWSLTLREAQTMTCADIFLALTLCFVIATIMVPLMRKVGPPKAPSADAH